MKAFEYVKSAVTSVDNFILTEFDVSINGEFQDTICEVTHLIESDIKCIYCSIPDALAHKGEWYYV